MTAQSLEARLFEYVNSDHADKEILDRLLAIQQHEYGRTFLRAALDAIENDSGCDTPAEHFVSEILHAYGCGFLNPASVRQSLAEYSENLRGVEDTVRRFATHYPHRFANLAAKIKTRKR